MKVVLQRVDSASVHVAGETVGKIGKGLLLLIGVAETDTKKDIEFVADKCVNLRIFQDENGKMNKSLIDVGGAILAVSQFTLLGDTKKGRRPSFVQAASAAKGEEYYNYFIECVEQYDIPVETGVFGAMMEVELINSGPVTLIIESK